MKKFWIFVAVCFLTGCTKTMVYESVTDTVAGEQGKGMPGSIKLDLIQDCWVETSADGSDTVYGLEGGEIRTCVLQSGNLPSTLVTLTGLQNSAVEPIMTAKDTWQVAWTTADEQGLMACRSAIWEKDGYHYCVSLLVPESRSDALTEEFQLLLQNVTISNTAP